MFNGRQFPNARTISQLSHVAVLPLKATCEAYQKFNPLHADPCVHNYILWEPRPLQTPKFH